jgi:multidrug resistance efflux pump
MTCVTVAGGRVWLRLPAQPSTLVAANKLRAGWLNQSNPTWLVDAQAAATPERATELAAAQTQAQQDRDAKAAARDAASTTAAALKGELDGLPARIQAAQAELAPAEAALQAPKAEASAANAKVSSLTGSYNSAMNNRSAIISCQVLVMFGFSSGPCGSTAPYDAAIAQYRAAVAEADAAMAKYTSYYTTYKAKYDTYRALFDRRAAATNEYNAALAGVTAAQAGLDSAESVLSAANGRVSGVAVLQEQIARLAASQTAVEVNLSRPIKGTGASWVKSFDRASMVAAKHRVYLAQTMKAYRTLASYG